MSNNISCSRLAMLFKHDWVSHWKDKAILAGLIFGLTILAYSLRNILPSLHVTFIGFLIWIIILTPAFFCSHIFHNMRTKQQKIAYLMIPATRAEKYIVRFVDYVIIPPIIATVTFLIAMAVVCMFSNWYIDFHECYDFIKNTLSELQGLEDKKILFSIVLVVITAMTAGLSAFILGGTIFKSHAMAKTILVLIILQVLMSALSLNISDLATDHGNNTFFAVTMAASAFYILVIIACVTASYLLFSRKQVI
ncbi:MAG: hypothetical protein MJZ13_10650 [Bacteroidales bacterium]|nr:hypothetical protein [Bacteroidales bacterium]